VPVGTQFVLILNDNTDAVTGTFNGLPQNATVNVNGQSFQVRYNGGTGNDVVLVRGAGTAGAQLANGGFSNGAFNLKGTGGASTIYVVQASTNFLQWSNIGSATGNLSGAFTFNDTNAFRYRYRFYRTAN
jgi:hypothetical protein